MKNERQEEIICEESPIGESSSNGKVENAIRHVQGIVWSLKPQLEEKLELKL